VCCGVVWCGGTHVYILPGVVQSPELLLLLVVVDSRHCHHDKDSAENCKTLPKKPIIREISHVLWRTKMLAWEFSSPQATPFRHFQRGPGQRISMPRSRETPETDPSTPRVRSPCPATSVRTKPNQRRKGRVAVHNSTSSRCFFHGDATTGRDGIHGLRVHTRSSQDRPEGRNSSQRNAGVSQPGTQGQLRGRRVG
jgi:hypothetical protein